MNSIFNAVSYKSVPFGINVCHDNLDIFENSKKYAFIKLENFSNCNMEEVFFHSIALLEENGALLVDLQKYQHYLLRTMMFHHCFHDFSNAEIFLYIVKNAQKIYIKKNII